MFRLSISAPIVINKATSFDLLWRHATCYLKYKNRKLHQDNVLIFNVTRLTRGVLPFSSSLEIRLLSCFKILLTTSILPFFVARCKGFSSLSFFKVPMNGLVISISISTNSIWPSEAAMCSADKEKGVEGYMISKNCRKTHGGFRWYRGSTVVPPIGIHILPKETIMHIVEYDELMGQFLQNFG